jgi:hypothetical protein
MPSFSKDCYGGFVGFQGLTIDPNGKVDPLLIFVPNPWSKRQSQAPDQVAIGRATCIHVSTNPVFPKEKTLCLPRAHDMAGLESQM